MSCYYFLLSCCPKPCVVCTCVCVEGVCLFLSVTYCIATYMCIGHSYAHNGCTFCMIKTWENIKMLYLFTFVYTLCRMPLFLVCDECAVELGIHSSPWAHNKMFNVLCVPVYKTDTDK